jgi:hypothetical protein
LHPQATTFLSPPGGIYLILCNFVKPRTLQLVGQVRIIAACIILCNFGTFELWKMRWGDAVAECVNDVCEKDLEREDKATTDHDTREHQGCILRSRAGRRSTCP